MPVAVRHRALVAGDRLCVIGGGAFCFSFGSVFGATVWLPVAALCAQLAAVEADAPGNKGLTGDKDVHDAVSQEKPLAAAVGAASLPSRSTSEMHAVQGAGRSGPACPAFVVLRPCAAIAQRVLKAADCLDWSHRCAATGMKQQHLCVVLDSLCDVVDILTLHTPYKRCCCEHSVGGVLKQSSSRRFFFRFFCRSAPYPPAQVVCNRPQWAPSHCPPTCILRACHAAGRAGTLYRGGSRTPA